MKSHLMGLLFERGRGTTDVSTWTRLAACLTDNQRGIGSLKGTQMVKTSVLLSRAEALAIKKSVR